MIALAMRRCDGGWRLITALRPPTVLCGVGSLPCSRAGQLFQPIAPHLWMNCLPKASKSCRPMTIGVSHSYRRTGRRAIFNVIIIFILIIIIIIIIIIINSLITIIIINSIIIIILINIIIIITTITASSG